MVYGCGAGPQGDCTTSLESGCCVGASPGADFSWEFCTNADGTSLLGWCGDEQSPSVDATGPGIRTEVDPATGEVTVYFPDGARAVISC
jgi:hypothetical protein